VPDDFLGRGWAFPVGTDSGGGVRLVAGEADVEQAIRLILSTAPGERVMRPEFGCDIRRYAFATVDTTTRTLIETDVRDALVRWEPRIELLDVTAELTDPDAGRLTVEVDYRVRETNEERSLVHPFSLGGG
jgi:hypothetical protein